jgi:hypothetical protein
MLSRITASQIASAIVDSWRRSSEISHTAQRIVAPSVDLHAQTIQSMEHGSSSEKKRFTSLHPIFR